MPNPSNTQKKLHNFSNILSGRWLVFLIVGCIGLVLVSILGTSIILYALYRKPKVSRHGESAKEQKLLYVDTCEELQSRIELYQKTTSSYGGFSGKAIDMVAPNSSIQSEANTGSTPYHTNTNVQVAGIDESDIVKTDGKSVFTLNTSKNSVKIFSVYPFSEAKQVSEITFSSQSGVNNEVPIEMFLTGNKLVVLSRSYLYSTDSYQNEKRAPSDSRLISPVSNNFVTAAIYDVSNTASPKLIENQYLQVEGNFVTARLKNNIVYLVTNSYRYVVDYPVPYYREQKDSSLKQTTDCKDIAILDSDYAYPSFTTVSTLDLNQGKSKPAFKNYMGNTQTVYMGDESIYLVSQRSIYSRGNGILPLIGIGDSSRGYYSELSVITKLKYDKESISYAASTKFDGHLLNQFSLDEYQSNLRIAGTINESDTNRSRSYLRTYDKDLNELAVIDNLARGEKIYSVRFNGKRGVVVTFKKVDPLFVFDLSDAKKPRLEGELKIPGYSDYLHFIDDNTVIGFGKDAIEASSDLKERRDLNFAWYQGLKMAVFDISNMNEPKEVSKVMLGDRGSDSPALSNHRAFMYDPVHKVIIVPASISKVDPATCQTDQSISPCYGKPVSQGAQVIRINDKNELSYAGEISHGQVLTTYSSIQADLQVSRAFVVESGIITISNGKVLVNDINTLNQITAINVR